MFDTQLSDADNFDLGSISFKDPEDISFTDNAFRKIKIYVRNPDGSIGDLVFSAPRQLFSFGIQELTDGHGNTNGYIMPISLWKRKEPTPDEEKFIETLNQIVGLALEQVHKYVDTSTIDTKRFSPLSFKKHSEREDDRKSPILYTKLIFNKRDQKISSLFFDEATNTEIDPLSILNKKCYVTAAIKIESIFIGDKITLQIKLYEAIVKVLKQNRRLLTNDAATAR
ncbi:DUF2738 domain-containing protein [bacterium]|nr:DUF2738 domain-containing protein [bacterium]